MAENEEGQSLLIKVKEESEEADLKLIFQKNKYYGTSPITSWQMGREKVETVTDSIFLGSKFTEDGDLSHEIQRWLPLGRKAITNPDSVLKTETTVWQQTSTLSKLWFF